MKRIVLAAAAMSALGLTACQQSTDGNGATKVEINGAKIGESVENGLKDAGNLARDAGNVVGNELAPAANAVKNGAREAWNGVKEGVRDIRNNDEPVANTAK
jgi:hypothetical protein